MTETRPEDDPLYLLWLSQQNHPARAAAAEPATVTEAEPEPAPAGEPEPEPAEVPSHPLSYDAGYSRSTTAWQGAVGADQPSPADETAAWPVPVDHLARAHAAGGHQGLGHGISN
jgi:hypothetical protein